MPRLSQLLLTASIAVLVIATDVCAETSWKAGVAKAVITPDSPMWMAGYAARNRPAEGKMTDLWAKALALEDAKGKRCVLVTLDLVGIERGLSGPLRDEIQKKYGLERSQIAINCSHTHSGPVVARNLRPMHEYALEKSQQELIHKYADRLHASVVALVGKALENLAPVKFEWGSGSTDFAVNRRNNKEAEVPKLREAGQPLVGPVDHNVPVLAVKDSSGKLIAVAFGYACHATVLDGYDWSGDYPGFAQIELEKKHPGAVALFWAGCGADQNPIPRRKPELAEKYGKQLADELSKVLGGTMQTVEPSLATSYAEIDLPLATLPTRDELVAQTNDTNKYIAMRAKMLLEDIDEGKPLKQNYPYPVQHWRLGDVQWFFLGGEVVVDFAIRTKAELGGTKTWLAGYTNDVMGYIPSRRVLNEGGYEGGGAMVYYGMPTIWSEQVEEVIMQEIGRQAEDAKKQLAAQGE